MKMARRRGSLRYMVGVLPVGSGCATGITSMMNSAAPRHIRGGHRFPPRTRGTDTTDTSRRRTEQTDQVPTAPSTKESAVTAREAEVLALLARHLTNAQIADTLFISVRTVESHVSALLRKLDHPDRRSLARHAAPGSRHDPDLHQGPLAAPGDVVRRPHRRTGGAGGGARRASHGHRDRPRRRRQDPAGAERRRRDRPAPPRRGLVRRSCPA